jgi:hypothetical protein
MMEAYVACCSLGMGLVSLETHQETKDLAIFTQNLSELLHICCREMCFKIMLNLQQRVPLRFGPVQFRRIAILNSNGALLGKNCCGMTADGSEF